MTARAAHMKTGKIQLKPRGRWKSCVYEERPDGMILAIVGGKVYLAYPDQLEENR